MWIAEGDGGGVSVPLFQDQPAARPRLVYLVDKSADSPSRSCEEPVWWYRPAAAQQHADSVDVAVAARRGAGAPPRQFSWTVGRVIVEALART
jgi:hypothetical protein